MFSTLAKNVPPMNHADVVSLRQLPTKDWLGVSNYKSLIIGNETDKTFHIGGLDYVLISLGVSSTDRVNYLMEQHGKKLNNLKAKVSEQMGEINIKYEVESPKELKNDVLEMADMVISSLCPISNTLKSKTQINMKGKVF